MSVSFFNLLLTLTDMPGIWERMSTAFNLVTKCCILEPFSLAALKQESLCIIDKAIEGSFLYI